MSDLKKKSQARNGHKTFVKKVMSKVEELLENDTNDMSKLEACKVSLDKQLKEIEKLDGEIAELVDEENIEREIFERCDFEAAV
jgi:hypothetical protein